MFIEEYLPKIQGIGLIQSNRSIYFKNGLGTLSSNESGLKEDEKMKDFFMLDLECYKPKSEKMCGPGEIKNNETTFFSKTNKSLEEKINNLMGVYEPNPSKKGNALALAEPPAAGPLDNPMYFEISEGNKIYEEPAQGPAFERKKNQAFKGEPPKEAAAAAAAKKAAAEKAAAAEEAAAEEAAAEKAAEELKKISKTLSDATYAREEITIFNREEDNIRKLVKKLDKAKIKELKNENLYYKINPLLDIQYKEVLTGGSEPRKLSRKVLRPLRYSTNMALKPLKVLPGSSTIGKYAKEYAIRTGLDPFSTDNYLKFESAPYSVDGTFRVNFMDNIFIKNEGSDNNFLTYRAYLMPPIFDSDEYKCKEPDIVNKGTVFKKRVLGTLSECEKNTLNPKFEGAKAGEELNLCIKMADMQETRQDRYKTNEKFFSKYRTHKKNEKDDFVRRRSVTKRLSRCFNV